MTRMLDEFRPEGDECLVWPGKLNPDGYGTVSVKGKADRVHRAAFIVAKGEIPGGHEVCHECDHPACFRPSHLFSGTHVDNMRDMAAKGRRAGRNLGPTNAASVLTAELVKRSREEYLSGSTSASLSVKYGVSECAMTCALTGKTWSYVPGAVTIRPRIGMNRGQVKLTDENVREIRRMATRGKPHASIARDFNVSSSSVHCILKGKTWTHIA